MKAAHYTLVAVAAILACRDARGGDGVPLSGVVEDQAAGVVLTAKLTLTNKESGAELKAKPNEQGEFRFEEVLPGQYTLKVKAESFETTELTVKVRNTEPKPLRIRMALKSTAEEITVTAEKDPGLTVEPGENANAIKIDESLLMALPVDGQDVLGAISNFLSPAAQGAMGPSIVVDGVEASMFDVPANSIKRIRINKNPYSAQFRRPGNARIEVTTRDPRSNFHGGISIFDRDSALGARNPFAQSKPDTNKRLYQTHLTGPIKGTKLWFFFNVERVNDNQSATVNALTPAGLVNQNVPTPTNRTNFLGRIDYRPSLMHTMDVRYVFIDTTQHNRSVGGFKLPESGYSSGERESTFEFADHRIAEAGFNNDFRVQFERGSDQEGSLATARSLVVKGAFTAGPSQTFDSERETTFRLQNVTNYYKGKHRVQFGGQIRPRFVDARQQSDFAGVFEFTNLSTFAAGQPFVFRVNQGNPAISFTQHEAFDFLQDNFLLSPSFSLLVGLRHEWHDGPVKANHLAPRIGFAWSPGKSRKIVLRAGTGIFYESVPKSVIRRPLLFDGVRMLQFVIPNPSFPDPFAGGIALLPQSIVRTDAALTLPYLAQASVGIERALSPKVQLSAEYRTLRAVNVFRSRDINAPLPGTQVRPDPKYLNITEVESAATMRSNALEVDVRWSAKHFSGMAQYTLSRTDDDAYGLFTSPANNYDLHPEWGRADFDRRHQFNLMGTATVPGKIRLGVVATIGSALPFNITTGEDNNHDTVAADRLPGGSRNTGIGGGVAQVNLRFSKMFETRRLLKKHKKDFENLELNIDSFNIFNSTNYERFVGVLNSPFYGRANAALPARTVQASMRYSW